MAYNDHFQLADDVVTHLQPMVAGINDQFLVTRYVGFLSVCATTVYELAIKEIFINFATAKHNTFGSFTEKHFSRLNGRIRLPDLRGEHIARFGDKYRKRFDRELDRLESQSLLNQGVSVKSRYGNVITCRHDFAHAGSIPQTMTFSEIIDSYESGKDVIHCLARCMTR